MSYHQIGNSTVCKDTPQNRREFEDFCRMINAPGRYQKMAKLAKSVLEQEKKTVDEIANPDQ
jgi:hypothetical protein